jgi:hypothetical protein
MSLSDWLALVAIIVSLASAFATLYFQYFERPRVAVALGDELYLSYGEADGSGGYAKLGMVLSLSLVNNGACDALVTVIAATVHSVAHDVKADARWRAFYTPVAGGAAGESSSPVWTFNGWVRPLAATSRRVVTEWIYFRSSPLLAGLPVGEYTLRLEVTETRPAASVSTVTTGAANQRAVALWSGSFTIDAAAVAYLESKCVATDGMTPDSYRVAVQRR